jgi:diguanylate cyclase
MPIYLVGIQVANIIMTIKPHLIIRSKILKKHVNRYCILGLIIALTSILVGTAAVSYQMTAQINFWGLCLAQSSNPALWALDLTPFMFAYWGQSFCLSLAKKVEAIIADKTREFHNLSSELELQLKFESNYDQLTNLPNLRFLLEKIEQGIAQLDNNGNLVVIILNIKDFKVINTNFGTFNANNVLKQFAEKLSNLLVEPYILEESMGMSVVARLQNDEFALLIPKIKKDRDVKELLTKIIASTSTNYMIDGNNIIMNTIASAALYPEHGNDAESLLHHANIGVHHAKKEGNSFAIYHQEMADNSTVSLSIMKELKQAIDNDELEIYYQPNIELATGKIMGAEALVRFRNPRFGILNAEKFIHLVEGTSLIKTLTTFVLKGVVRQLNLWHMAGFPIYIAVNLSATDAADKQLIPFIKNLLIDNNISPEFLKLELTEKACLSDQVNTIQVVNELADFGIKFSIEDFGSGYTSFAYLTNYSISEIKIDKSFVMNMMNDGKKLIMVKAIIDLASTMRLDLLAMGIENEAILNNLIQLGCFYGQGFYFSPAVNADSFYLLLRNNLAGKGLNYQPGMSW